MIKLYIIASIGIALMFTVDIFILTHPGLSIKKHLMLFLTSSALNFLHIYTNYSPMLFVTLTVTSLLLITFTKKLYSVFYMPFGYILNCILLNLISFAGNMLWNISIKELNSDQYLMIIYMSCTIAASCPVLYLVRRLLDRSLISIFEKMDKKMIAFISLTLLLCAFMIFTMASFFDTLEITHREFFLMVSSLVLYFLFTMCIIFIVLYESKKSYEAQKKVEYLENLNEYTKNLEMVYNNLRSFRHDYINIMTSLAAYIDEKKYDELETFFYDHILPVQKNLTQKNSSLNSLLHIHILELKSILYTKLILAVNQDIEVNIDIPDEIDSIDMDPIDLTRMLGIYLDNAVEACLETRRPAINLHLGKMNEDVVIIISNTFIDKGLSITQMHKKEVTTKKAGHGIGLYNVSEILNRYDNIYHETLIKEDLFIQQVQITKMRT
ncbi:MAG: GHKL domain-containing protein [Lachnospiraceae bacterium]|nr:GHKL domain-containing protein [Lachnospiraceae bacterium]